MDIYRRVVYLVFTTLRRLIDDSVPFGYQKMQCFENDNILEVEFISKYNSNVNAS